MISRRIHIKHLATLFLGSTFISACSTEQSLLDPKTIAQEVAKHYGESSPTITSVKKDSTDNPPHDPMYTMRIAGHFQKGSLIATSLGFSALANRMYAWDIRGYNASEQEVWFNPDLTHELFPHSSATP
ncbi:hypothetical protein KSC_076910 [Ktedonobacter sp. SOSP1-52]|nr:hypothetical protein KSC_076910 [Ktedonobacter sp. SOSP1-52]